MTTAFSPITVCAGSSTGPTTTAPRSSSTPSRSTGTPRAPGRPPMPRVFAPWSFAPRPIFVPGATMIVSREASQISAPSSAVGPRLTFVSRITT